MSSPVRSRRLASRSRLQRAGWMLACLWLLVALMPLRAWAAAEMLVVQAGLPGVAVVEAADLPPCHMAASAHDADASSEHGACVQCVFCAPVMATAAAPGVGLSLPTGAPPAAAPAPAPAGALGTLFRPPRG